MLTWSCTVSKWACEQWLTGTKYLPWHSQHAQVCTSMTCTCTSMTIAHHNFAWHGILHACTWHGGPTRAHQYWDASTCDRFSLPSQVLQYLQWEARWGLLLLTFNQYLVLWASACWWFWLHTLVWCSYWHTSSLCWRHLCKQIPPLSKSWPFPRPPTKLTQLLDPAPSPCLSLAQFFMDLVVIRERLLWTSHWCLPRADVAVCAEVHK